MLEKVEHFLKKNNWKNRNCLEKFVKNRTKSG